MDKQIDGLLALVDEVSVLRRKLDTAQTIADAARSSFCAMSAERDAAIARAEAAEAAQLALTVPCVWVTDGKGKWYSDCERGLYIEGGTPADRLWDFCPGCGHPLTWESAVQP